MEIRRNGNETTLELTCGEMDSMAEAIEIGRTFATLRRHNPDEFIVELEDLYEQFGEDRTITVWK